MVRLNIGDFADNFCAEEQNCVVYDADAVVLFDGAANEIPEGLRDREIDVVGSVSDDAYSIGIWTKAE